MSDSDRTDSTSGGPSKKRRRTSSITSTCLSPVCVIHVPGLKRDKYGEIKLFSSKKYSEETFVKIQEIKSRRLAEP